MNQTPTDIESGFDVRRLALAVALVACGLVVNGGAFLAIGVQQQGRWPAAATPFAIPSVLILHLLGVVPLTLWLSRALINGSWRRPHRRRWIFVAGWIAVGLVVVVLSGLAASAVQRMESESSSGGNEALRLAWSALLMLPWSAAAVLVGVRPGDTADTVADRPATASGRSASAVARRTARSRHLLFWTDGLIAGLLAMLPSVHVQQVVERQTALLTDATVNRQYVRAAQICNQLGALGTAQIAGQPTVELIADFREIVNTFTLNVNLPLAADASVDQRLERASQLYSLGRFEEVESSLRGLTNNPRAQQRLALADEAQGNYQRAAERYEKSIELVSTQDPLPAQDLSLLRSALERRVNNLRRIGENGQAESELLEALERWPQARDAILMQLAFHYQMAGRTREAIDFFQQAAAANPRLESQADAAVAQLQTQAEGCLLRSTRGATR